MSPESLQGRHKGLSGKLGSRARRGPASQFVDQEFFSGGNAFVKSSTSPNRWLIMGHDTTLHVYDMLSQGSESHSSAWFHLEDTDSDSENNIFYVLDAVESLFEDGR